jgi:hypothetical protein
MERAMKRWSDETLMCWFAALVTFAVGTIGSIIGRAYPISIPFEAFWAVSGFYFVLMMVSLFKSPAPASMESTEIRASESADDDLPRRDGVRATSRERTEAAPSPRPAGFAAAQVSSRAFSRPS